MKKIITGIVLLLIAFSLNAQKVSIVLDGNTSDWKDPAADMQDSKGDGANIDITSLSVNSDTQFLYLRFTLNADLLLNSDNDLWLYIDTDNNASTGTAIQGIGSDLRWHFGGRQGWYRDNKDKIYHNQLDLVALPTVSSDTFEVRIDRQAKLAKGQPFFSANTIKIVLKDGKKGDAVPDKGSVFEYTFTDQGNTFHPLELQRPDGTSVRVMSYNVLHDGIVKEEKKPYFRRIIRAASPDVVVLNECWDSKPEEVREIFNEFIPLAGGASWHAIKKDYGNILVSRYPFSNSWLLDEEMRLTAALVDLPDEKFTTDFMVVGAHFRCCAANDKRQREADAFIEFILDAKTPGGRIELQKNTPFFLAGDLNLVGDAQQLETLLKGEIINEEFGKGGDPDWDNTALFDVISSHTDEPVANTWRSNKSSYWPGRLDFTIISNSVCEVTHAWTLETGNMSDQRLYAYNLKKNDTEEASDHLPKVTDLKFTDQVLVSDTEEVHYKVFANKANRTLHITGDSHKEASAKLFKLSTGKIVETAEDLNKKSESITLNIEDAQKGVYVLVLYNQQGKIIYYEKVAITD